jgi:YVTN family beta-propeller protein
MTDESLPPTQSGRQLSPYIPVGTQIGAYRIEAFVDRGGMASIYQATDLRLNRTVALKVLGHEVSDSTDFRERFIRESQFAASIDHPNIVPIYESGEDDGLLYIAMRYVRGSNLAQLLRSGGSLEPKHALGILGPVADALDTAHNAGLVHRDVKPANILLTTVLGHEGHEHVYLTDFGLTKRTSALTKLTATGNFIGTMAYISPEQIRGEPLDSRTDMYALGCVAYECLTGVPPFVRDDQAALLWAHLSDPPVAVSVHKPELSAADPVIAKALSKDPLERYESCDEFTQTLSDVLLTGRHSALNPYAGGGEAGAVAAAAAGVIRKPPADDTQRSAAAELFTTEAAKDDLPPAPDDAAASSVPPAVDPLIAEPSWAVDSSGPSGVQPVVAEPSWAAAGSPEEPDEPSSQSPPLADGQPPAGEQESSQQEQSDVVANTSAGPSSPPVVETSPPAVPPDHPGPDPMIRRRRRTRRRTVFTVLAAALAVAAVIAVAVWVRPTTETVAGSGRPAGAPVTGESSGSAGPSSPTATGESTPATPSSQQALPPPPTTTPAQPTPGPAVTRPTPVASLAIPTVQGDPVPVGDTPGFVAISPDGHLAYIANRGAGYVTVLDTTINKVVAQVPVPAGPPWFIAFTPDGSRAYVSVYNDDLTINDVAVFDTRSSKLLDTIPVDQKPYALAVTPNQKFVYVPSHNTGAIDIIDINENKVVQTVPVAPNPHWVAFDAAGKFAYITDHESNVVTVLDTGSNNVVTTIPVGTSPHSIEVSPDGTQAAVVCYDSNDVYFIDTATNAVIGTVPVGLKPQDLTYAPDGKHLYTANVDGNSVSVVDTDSRTVSATIPTDSPTSVAVLPNGRTAYVTNLNDGTLRILNVGG